jgi:hypothetical protein
MKTEDTASRQFMTRNAQGRVMKDIQNGNAMQQENGFV